VASSIAITLVWLVPVFVLAAIAGLVVHSTELRTELVRDIPGVLAPVLVYATIAGWIAYIKWLQWLESRAEGSMLDATKIANHVAADMRP
jgi:hypothetical protein